MRISDWSSDVCSSDLHRAAFGTEILHAPVETWPANYPNVEQARFLLRNGAPEPVIATLTRIGTVEGFGSLIRFLAPTDMQRHFDDDIRGTAPAHLAQGLVEAHARAPAGWTAAPGTDPLGYPVRDLPSENTSTP